MNMNAPQVPDSESPIWIRLYGHWVRMQGILPVIGKESQRSFSELVTVDGYRYEQRAPRGPRSWSLDYRYATAAATAALESAAYDYNSNDPSMRTLLLDTNEAKINMVPPDLLTQWKGTNDAAISAVNVGESEGLPMWLASYGTDATEPTSPYWQTQIPVRGGVTYTVTAWVHTLGTASVAVNVTGAAVGSANGLTGSTAANPHQATVVVTPVADGTLTIQTVMQFSAGLMVYEGDCPPTSYRAGRRMPCSISVREPASTTNPIWRNCNPCTLPREHTSWTINEVGMDALTPLDIGVS